MNKDSKNSKSKIKSSNVVKKSIQVNKNKIKNKIKNKYSKDKLDLLLEKLDILQSLSQLPGKLNSSIKSFYSNNKYIIYGLVVLLLGSVGYNAYNYSREVLYPSTQKVNIAINRIYDVINTDDEQLNDMQLFIKYLYLYSLKVGDKEVPQKLKEIYDKNSNLIIKDLEEKLSNSLQTKLSSSYTMYSEKLKKDVYDALYKNPIDSIKSNTSNVFSFLSDTVSSLFVSNLDTMYKNKDLLSRCFYKNRSSTKTFEEFVENYKLESDLDKSLVDKCYKDVEPLISLYTDPDKVENCIPLKYTVHGNNIQLNLIHFLVFNVNELLSFDDCYNEINQ